MERRHGLTLVPEPVKDPDAPLEFKSLEKLTAEQDAREISDFHKALRLGWTSALRNLSLQEADVVWRLLDFQPEEEIAEHFETSSIIIEGIRERAEQKLGGKLPF